MAQTVDTTLQFCLKIMYGCNLCIEFCKHFPVIEIVFRCMTTYLKTVILVSGKIKALQSDLGKLSDYFILGYYSSEFSSVNTYRPV
jgi:hypothetical protein